jgi:hypothetical protein
MIASIVYTAATIFYATPLFRSEDYQDYQVNAPAPWRSKPPY